MNKLLAILLSLLVIGTTMPNIEEGTESSKAEPVDNEITVRSSASFTDKLYSAMPKDKNYMYSPFSIKSALAMAANGASDRTQREILNAVGIDDLDEFNEDMKATIEKYTATDLLRLDISNSVWLNTDNAGYDFSKEYSDTVGKFYRGEVGKVTSSNAVREINGWVKEKTNGKIPSVINSPDFDTALINAIYFKAKWDEIFSDVHTKPDTFTDRNGKKSEIDFMNDTRKIPYGEHKGVRVVELEYLTRGAAGKLDPQDPPEDANVRLDTNVSMFVLLSDTEITEPERIVSELYMNMESRKVNLSIPKFKIEFSAELSPVLKSLGIKSAFGDADFSSMFGGKANTKISNVLHKTYIDVDEEGTEAAAVTAIMMAGAAMPSPEEIIDFKADKPFTFLIRDNRSGETLFIGEYAFAN